jgi:hypothetical protein
MDVDVARSEHVDDLRSLESTEKPNAILDSETTGGLPECPVEWTGPDEIQRGIRQLGGGSRESLEEGRMVFLPVEPAGRDEADLWALEICRLSALTGEGMESWYGMLRRLLDAGESLPVGRVGEVARPTT